ncbi:MAG: hypothetical protein RIA69_09950 [Cyclobacteriaceae bacterium]
MRRTLVVAPAKISEVLAVRLIMKKPSMVFLELDSTNLGMIWWGGNEGFYGAFISSRMLSVSEFK